MHRANILIASDQPPVRDPCRAALPGGRVPDVDRRRTMTAVPGSLARAETRVQGADRNSGVNIVDMPTDRRRLRHSDTTPLPERFPTAVETGYATVRPVVETPDFKDAAVVPDAVAHPEAHTRSTVPGSTSFKSLCNSYLRKLLRGHAPDSLYWVAGATLSDGSRVIARLRITLVLEDIRVQPDDAPMRWRV